MTAMPFTRTQPLTDSPAARAVDVRKVYGRTAETRVEALAGVTVQFDRARFTAIMGPSGSGKSTLMHILAGLDAPTEGEVWIGGVPIHGLRDRDLTRLRREKIGFVFQQYNLLPTLSALENITLPLAIAGRKPDTGWLEHVVETVNLDDRLAHRPSELSGGQQQRVALARALVTKPEVVLADEPTGNLDSRSGAEVLRFMQASVQDHGQTIVMVTHDPTAASYADRVVFLKDGQLVGELATPSAEAVLDRLKTLDGGDHR